MEKEQVPLTVKITVWTLIVFTGLIAYLVMVIF